MCLPEAAAVMHGYVGRPEDNAAVSQEPDGNSSVCPLHPEEHTQGTWSAVSLHLKHKTCRVFMKTSHNPFKHIKK